MTQKPDHPNFERCYNEGQQAAGSDTENPYVPGTDEFKFFEAGVAGDTFEEVELSIEDESNDE